MSRMNQYSYTSQNNIPVSEDQMRRIAPSIYAEDKHEARSSRYTYIPTSNIVERLASEGYMPMTVAQSRSRSADRRAFTKHMIRFRHRHFLENNPHHVRKVGDVYPEVVLINSHDGTSSYQMWAGLFRLICLNGMIVSDGSCEGIRVGHSGRIVERVIEATHLIAQNATTALEVSQEWRGIMLNRQEQLALAESAYMVRFDVDSVAQTSDASAVVQAIKPAQLLIPRRSEDKEVHNSERDLWTTFNVVQENVIRGGQSGQYYDEKTQRVRTRSAKAVNSVTNDVKINKALWHLGAEMHKIKTVGAM